MDSNKAPLSEDEQDTLRDLILDRALDDAVTPIQHTIEVEEKRSHGNLLSLVVSSIVRPRLEIGSRPC